MKNNGRGLKLGTFGEFQNHIYIIRGSLNESNKFILGSRTFVRNQLPELFDCLGIKKRKGVMKMGIFGGKESKEEKQERERQKMMEKLGLDELNDKDLETVTQIMTDLAGTGGILGQVTAITFSAADMQKVNAAWAQVRQNWIIMRQLDRLNKNIEKLIEIQGGM